ncbi:MAG: HesA/MoeB/ThiF family protein [Bacteroidales bacterium]
MRYQKHTMLKEIGEEGQQKLLSSSVLIVGVGGLGCPIALYLTAAGVGRIGLIDEDVVSLSNLQRQILYTENDIANSKVECAKKKLQLQSAHTRIDAYNLRLTAQNAKEIIALYDIVVDGCDNFATRYLINDTCVALGKPYVYGAIGEFTGQVSVFNYLGGADYRFLFPDEKTLTHKIQKEQGVMGVVPGVVGSIEAAEVIKMLTHCGNVLRNQLFTIDLLTMESALYRIKED